MKSLPIICYHGSPGLPDEFMLLEKHLPGQRIVKIIRAGYGTNDKKPIQEDTILLGYSWGAVDALRDATKYAGIKGLILVSPYFFPNRKLSPVKKTLLLVPVVSDLILAISGNKIISKMLVETSAPDPVPSAYKEMAKQLVAPKLLRKAALEKDISKEKLQAAIEALGNSNLPVAVIWGSEDRIGKEAEQIDPLRKYISFSFEKRLEAAGHAIVWTHPSELAKFVDSFQNSIKDKVKP